jgi:hypothetical protein
LKSQNRDKKSEMILILAFIKLSLQGTNAPYIVSIHGDIDEPKAGISAAVRTLWRSDEFQRLFPNKFVCVGSVVINFNNRDPFTNDETIGKCAVVGNSPSLRGRRKGVEIDVCDEVPRESAAHRPS